MPAPAGCKGCGATVRLALSARSTALSGSTWQRTRTRESLRTGSTSGGWPTAMRAATCITARPAGTAVPGRGPCASGGPSMPRAIAEVAGRANRHAREVETRLSLSLRRLCALLVALACIPAPLAHAQAASDGSPGHHRPVAGRLSPSGWRPSTCSGYCAQVTGRVPRVGGIWHLAQPGQPPPSWSARPTRTPPSEPSRATWANRATRWRTASSRASAPSSRRARTPAGAVNAILRPPLGASSSASTSAARRRRAPCRIRRRYTTLCASRPSRAGRAALVQLLQQPHDLGPRRPPRIRRPTDPLRRELRRLPHPTTRSPSPRYPEKGKMVWGARPAQHPRRRPGHGGDEDRRVRGDSPKLFADDYFGAATCRIADPDEAIRAEQAVMRDALDYAHRRGLKTCLGFEMTGDPTNPADREVFLKRVNHVLDTYPMLDYLWIWQSETGARPLPAAGGQPSGLSRYAAARRDTFPASWKQDGERPFFQETPEGKAPRQRRAPLEQYASWPARPEAACGGRAWSSPSGAATRNLSPSTIGPRQVCEDVVFYRWTHRPARPHRRVDGQPRRVASAGRPGSSATATSARATARSHVRSARPPRRSGSLGLLMHPLAHARCGEDYAYLMRSAWTPR